MGKEHLRLKNEIVGIIKKNMRAKHFKLFFFGSRVNGQASERSDIDIGIEADGPLPQRVMREIKEELENLRTLNRFDFVDFKAVDADFRRIAMKNIEVIYER